MTQRLEINTPEYPGAEEAAQVILKLLQQDVENLELSQLNPTFFKVLADFEGQAAAAGILLEENPFRRISDELVEWLTESTLAGMQADDVPEGFSEDIGRFRHMVHEAQHQPGMLLPAIKLMEEVVLRIDREAHPAFRATAYNELGTAYADLQVPDRRKALSRALTCYQIALEHRTVDKAPNEYAATQYNQGNALLHMPADGDERAQNLSQAVAAFAEALHLLALPDEAPADFALISLGLGTALALLPTGDQEANFAQALAFFDQTLSVFSREAHLGGFALVQMRLGASHYHGAGDVDRANAA